MKCPHLPLYTGDWLKDAKLSMCSPATRGVWIDLICAMHDLDRSGELRGTTEQLSRLARCSTVDIKQTLTELQANGAAKVEQRNEVWVVTNFRMKREAELREKRAFSGSKGGSKTQALSRVRACADIDIDNVEEGVRRVREFARGEGIPASDAEWFFWKGKGNGWTNGGKPILDWKATLRSWNKAGYLPSQKQKSHAPQPYREQGNKNMERLYPKPEPIPDLTPEQIAKNKEFASEMVRKVKHGSLH